VNSQTSNVWEFTAQTLASRISDLKEGHVALFKKKVKGIKMFIERKTDGGLTAIIIVPWSTEKRLRSTCYRGPMIRRAGNFMRFNSSDDLLGDQIVINALLSDLDKLWRRKWRGHYRFSITCPDFVGWESTAPLKNFAPTDLEPFEPNKKSSALRVRLDRPDLVAPKTREIVIIAEVRQENGNPVIILHSAYPGKEIGQLEGNITEREGRVFFTWEHLGEA
jgi:hypothetical protein